MRSRVVFVMLLVAACSKKEATPSTPTTIPPTGSAGVAADATIAADATVAADSAMAGSAMGSDQAMAGSGSGEGSGSGFDFDKLSHEEKIDFMKKKVMPPMKLAFQKFDKKEYAKFGCKTCHGKDPQKAKYKMPNPELPKLDFAKLKAGKQAPEMAEFMEKTVEPDMAKILGKPVYTPTNPNGFGCLDCHEQAK